MSNNPYEAPRAVVADFQQDDGANLGFHPQPQSLPAGRGIDWIKQGWALFAQNPGLWIGIYLVLIGVMMAAAFVPILGFIAQSVLYPVLLAGIAVGCDHVRRGQPLEFSHLFAGFSRNSSQLMMVGGIYLVSIIVVMVIAFVPTIGLVGGMAFLGQGDPDALAALMGFPILIGMLIYFALLLPVVMAMWFAPTLVILNDVPAVDALKFSFYGCLKNVLPFLLWSLAVLGLGFLSILTLFLGLLVLMPWIAASNYCAYREIYYRA